MLPIKIIVSLLTSLAVVGCANQSKSFWYKQNASQNELTGANYECLQEAQQVSGRSSYTKLDGNAFASSNIGAVTNTQLYNACMRSKGWQLRLQERAVSYDTPASSLSYCIGNNPRVWNNCVGTYTYPNGNKYSGEYRNGQRDGKGTMNIVAKGASNKNYIGSDIPATYVGEFRHDQLNGHGVLTKENGDRIEGIFVDNVLVTQDPK
jgi:hypothetical protein